uniref:Retrovirus-related Pol polyprotein from transposon TNT 1-94 n=1 Tax=Noccaea caerulescens TaxID=107243 RepID=A0A1J3K0P7_NOCCA
MTTTRIDVDRFDGTGDFSLWKVRMLAHFGVLGLKDILTDETLLRDSPTASKEELDAAKKDLQKGIAAETSMDPYASAVGSLMYAMVGSKPDLAFAVGLISRFMSEPGRDHWAGQKFDLCCDLLKVI